MKDYSSDRTTIRRDDDDPLAQMVWQVFDTGRPMVGTVQDDGTLTTRYLDEPVSRPTYRVGDRVHKAGNPASAGTITNVFTPELYVVRWDRWLDRVFNLNPYRCEELEASR